MRVREGGESREGERAGRGEQGRVREGGENESQRGKE